MDGEGGRGREREARGGRGWLPKCRQKEVERVQGNNKIENNPGRQEHIQTIDLG